MAAAQEQAGATDSLLEWGASELAGKLSGARESGRVWSLGGISEEQIYGFFPRLRAALEERGVLLLGMDPTGTLVSARTFGGVIDQFVRELERRGLLSEEVVELVTWLHASGAQELTSHEREVTLTETLGRLWRELCAVMPAALFVFYPERCGSQVQEQLAHVVRYLFHDPISELSPEYAAQERSLGAIVGVVREGRLPTFMTGPRVVVHELDASAQIAEQVRMFLARPEVVDSLVKSSRGDLGRLEELFSDLTHEIPHLMMRRVERLSAPMRRVVDLLSVRCEPLSMSVLHHALGPYGAGGNLGRELKGLLDAGLINRVVQLGSVRIGLVDPDLGEAARRARSESERRELHSALVDAAIAQLDGQERAVFVTRHALASGRDDVALEYGMSAARGLFASGALEEAAQVLDDLLGAAQADVMRAELHAMLVDVWARLGRWRRALKHCGVLKTHVAGSKGRAELAVRIAGLLDHMSRHETAASVIAAALEEIAGDGASVGAELEAKLLTQHGEAMFKLGRYDKALELASDAVARLDAAREQGTAPEYLLCRARLQASNLRGKVAILTARHDEAVHIFESNLAVAAEFGWDDERARAEGNLGIVAMQRFEYEEAARRLEITLAHTRHSHLISRAHCLLNLALIYHYQCRYTDALEAYLESLRAARQHDTSIVYNNAAQNLAMLYRDVGALDRSEALIAHVEDESRPNFTPFVSMRLTVTRASNAQELGDHTRVIELLEPHMLLDDNRDDVIGVGQTEKLRLAISYVEVGRAALATRLIDQIDTTRFAEERNLEALYLIALARVHAHAGEHVRACELLLDAKQVARHVGNFRAETRASYWRCEALDAAGDRAGAVAEAARAVADIVEHASTIPTELSGSFFELPLHRELALFAERIGVSVPVELQARDPEDSPRELVRDAAWMQWRARYSSIIGESERLHQLFHIIDRVAASDTPVLLYGESGTGKELFAEAVHNLSARSAGPLVKVNCAAFVESLLLSELFGHEKGAFTGAASEKIGRFEMANGGTIFLDEIADITPQTQVALLRVLQEKRFERVGGTTERTADVRIVCATNKNLEEMVEEGTFRLDLYFRLKGIALELPALRDRREDIPRLVEHFSEMSGQYTFERDAMRRLVGYAWPGNIRELQNFVRSILLFAEDNRVKAEHIEQFGDFLDSSTSGDGVDEILDVWESSRSRVLEVIEEAAARVESGEQQVVTLTGNPEDVIAEQIVANGLNLNDFKKKLELECIRRALIETSGNVTQAAKVLQMKRPRLSQIINANPELSELKDSLVS